MRKALWASLALTACASHSVHPLRAMDVPTAPYIEGAAAEDVDGSLTWEGGCLQFRSEGGERLLPIWPRASVFNGTSLMFHMPGKTDQPLLVTQQVSISGERLPADYAQANFGVYLQRCGGVPFFVAGVRPAD
jgi:hypothetical protein